MNEHWLTTEQEQALYDWLGVPSAEVADPFELYLIVRAAAEAGIDDPLPDKTDMLFELHNSLLDADRDVGRHTDPTLSAATGIARDALLALGMVETPGR